jgi:uncharacterized lipoprotein YbaY/heat shock protein HslJ
MGKITRRATLLAVLLAAFALLAPAASAQTPERCFAETGFCISGRIREFWEQNGGLPVFGLPLGPQAAEQVEGQTVQAQRFERTRLELHPENARPYDVLLGRIGADTLAAQGRDWFAFPKSEAKAGCRFFPETGHNVCGAIWRAWQASGLQIDGQRTVSLAESLALFGLPLSDELSETIEGKQYTVQWFERARFELHPANQPPYDVLLGRLGAEQAPANAPAASIPGSQWQLTSYGPASAPQAAVADAPSTLVFGADGQVSGSTGCNGFGGSYTVASDEITFGALVGTLIACEDARGEQERAIFATLKGTTRYELAGDTLRIFSADGQQRLEYSARATVTGTVTYRQRIALPDNAVILVQLLDVSFADAQAPVLGEQEIQAAGRQVPFEFAISYDPAAIDPRYSYAVSATITVDGQLRYTSTTRYDVITQGNPTTVEIVVEPV